MSELTMRCPDCHGEAFSSGAEIFDDRYGEPNRYQLANCTSCGDVATAPRLLEAGRPAFYGNYYTRKTSSADGVAREAAKASLLVEFSRSGQRDCTTSLRCSTGWRWSIARASKC